MSKWSSNQLTEEQAVLFYDNKLYNGWTHEQIVRFQLFQKRLCMPFDVFHNAVENVLGRSVWTHEFANRDSIVLEYLGEKPAPSLDEIIELIPEDKRIMITQ